MLRCEALNCLGIFAMLIGGCGPPTDGAGSVVAVFGGVGLGPGAFSYPRAIATSATGSVFIVDKSGRIQRFSENGAFETAWRMPEIQQGKPVGITVILICVRAL